MYKNDLIFKELDNKEEIGSSERVFITYMDLWREVIPGTHILLDDGLMDLEVIGTEEDSIYCNACRLLTDSEEYHRMARAVNPYGDGLASRRIADILTVWEKEGLG